MPNFFEQFDQPPAAPPPPAPSGNFFAQFHPQEPAAAPTPPPAPAKQPFGIGDIWPVRLAKGLVSAAMLPGEVYQGTAQVPQSANMPGGESTQNIGRTLDLASLISPVTPRAVPSLTKPVAAAAPTPEALQSAIDTGFTRARSTGAEVHPAALGRVSQEAQSGLTGAGVDATTAPKTFAVLGQLERPPSGATVTIANLHSLRKAFGNIATDAARQGANTEAMAARTAQQSLDSYLGNLPKTDVVAGDPAAAAQILRDAIGNAAAKFRSERVQEIGDTAAANVAASNTTGQLGAQIRQQAKQFLKSNDTRGFSKEELAQAAKVRSAGRTSGVAGSLAGGGGGVQAILAAILGHSVGLPAPIAPALGIGLKQFETLAAKRQLAKLDEMVRARSPLGQQTMGPPAPFAGGNPLGSQYLMRQLYPQLFGPPNGQ